MLRQRIVLWSDWKEDLKKMMLQVKKKKEIYELSLRQHSSTWSEKSCIDF